MNANADNTWAGSNQPAAALIGQISRLRQDVKGLDAMTAESLGTLLDSIADTARQIISEHAGMADELIGLYEQLGAVFSITRELPNVRDERAVTALFKRTLTDTFNRFEVVTAYPVAPDCDRPVAPVCDRLGAGDFDWRFEHNGAGITALAECEWARRMVADAVRHRRVRVQAAPDNDPQPRYLEVMAIPVFCAEEPVFVTLVGRGVRADEMCAADMNLAEVLTAYCGDLIANFRLHHELRQISVDLVRSLVSTVDQKDPYTCGHSVRVGYYAGLLGRELGLDNEALQMLEWSALLHDVGKIGIRDDVLKKPGRLTAEEYEHIKEHPVRSFEVVRRVPQLAGALAGIRHHHEHYDGGGYPDGLKGEDIPLQARIIQVADVFDALTSSRSYRQAFDWERALRILEEESGTTVDPNLAGVFGRIIRRRCEAHPQAWEEMTREADAMVFGNAPLLCPSTGEET